MSRARRRLTLLLWGLVAGCDNPHPGPSHPLAGSPSGAEAPPAATVPETPPATLTTAAAPPADTDGDGLSDGEDACPYQHRGPHPSPAEPGCPTHVRLAPNRIGLLSPIEFDIDKPSIRPASLPILDEIAFVLSHHPEIALVEVQAHGPVEAHAALNITQRRAQAVRDALVRRGVAASRLVARGYGEDVPLALPHTEEGRRLNRRVELWILPPPGAAP